MVHPFSSQTGLLIGACINRAPEGTFGAAVAEVGVMDLLKVTLDVLCICTGNLPTERLSLVP